MPKVGDDVEIHNYGDNVNGKRGKVIRIDGSYIYVKVPTIPVELELYPCELTVIEK